jgi:hypothetical protein
MTVTINGTTGIAGVDGSASTPSVQGADTNTGMFFPAADTIAFAEGGAEVMRIDSSGNVGIGTSSPAQYSSTIATLDIEKTGGAGIKFGNGTARFGIYYDNSSNASLIQTFSSNPISFAVNNTVVGQFDTSNNFNFNSGYGSSAVAYGCRAWVNFNGQGTVAIRGSGNVSSITDNGVGRYRINFSTSLVDANYSISGMSRETVTNGVCVIVDVGDSGSRNTSGFDIQTIGSSSFTLYDSAYNNVSVFR